jgi:hypothetical protein
MIDFFSYTKKKWQIFNKIFKKQDKSNLIIRKTKKYDSISDLLTILADK